MRKSKLSLGLPANGVPQRTLLSRLKRSEWDEHGRARARALSYLQAHTAFCTRLLFVQAPSIQSTWRANSAVHCATTFLARCILLLLPPFRSGAQSAYRSAEVERYAGFRPNR